MLKSSLLDIVRTFTKDDLSKFEDFVSSPYHNKKSNVIKLLTAVKKFAPDFNNKNLAKEEIWHKIFPGKDYNYGIMKNLIHDLTKLAESYVGLENFTSGIDQNRYLLNALFSRQLYKAFNAKLKNFDYKNNPSLLSSQDYFYNKMLINSYEILYNDIHSQNPINIDAGFKYTIMYFLDYIFDNAFTMYAGQESVNITYDFDFIEYIINYFEKNPQLLEQSLYVKFKYLAVVFLRNYDEKLLEEQIICFNKLKKVSSDKDKFEAYKIMMFIYETASRNKLKKYDKDLIALMIEMADKNIYSERKNTNIPLALFVNIIFVCQRFHAPELLKGFIERNMQKVSPEIRESLLTYCLGEISFMEKDYEKALYHFSRTDCNFSESNKDNYYCKLNAKTITTTCYYELNHPEQLLSEIDTSLHFLNNNKSILSSWKIEDANYFKILKEITLLRLKYDKIRLEKIRMKINTIDPLVYRNWLLEKIDELEILNNSDTNFHENRTFPN